MIMMDMHGDDGDGDDDAVMFFAFAETIWTQSLSWRHGCNVVSICREEEANKKRQSPEPRTQKSQEPQTQETI